MSKYIKVEDILSLAEKGVLISNSNYKKVCKAIENLPTIELKKGKWFILEYEFFTCDQCGEDVWNGAEYTQEARDMLKNGEYPNFCPNCGADMRGEQNNE